MSDDAKFASTCFRSHPSLSLRKLQYSLMTIVQISVPETTAKQYQQLTEQQKNALSALITNTLNEPTNLLEVMDYVSYKAEKRGLTPAVLSELVDD